MNGILKYICLACVFLNIGLAFWNFSVGAAWYVILLNFFFAGLCWYSYENS